jgi:hypothetical protein
VLVPAESPSAAAARLAALLAPASGRSALCTGGTAFPDGDGFGRVFFGSDPDSVPVQAGLLSPDLEASLTRPGEAATTVSCCAAEVTDDVFMAGEALPAEASGPSGPPALGACAVDCDLSPLGALDLSAALSEPTLIESALAGSDLPVSELPASVLSAPGDGHFGLVERDADRRAAEAGGGVAAEPEGLGDSGEAPLSALSIALPFDSGSGSPFFRTTVSGRPATLPGIAAEAATGSTVSSTRPPACVLHRHYPSTAVSAPQIAVTSG